MEGYPECKTKLDGCRDKADIYRRYFVAAFFAITWICKDRGNPAGNEARPVQPGRFENIQEGILGEIWVVFPGDPPDGDGAGCLSDSSIHFWDHPGLDRLSLLEIDPACPTYVDRGREQALCKIVPQQTRTECRADQGYPCDFDPKPPRGCKKPGPDHRQ